jgi:hypothetical protein
MEKPKTLEEWQVFVKSYRIVLNRKKSPITRSKVTNLLQTVILLITCLFQTMKARSRFASTGDVWLGAKLVMFAPFTWKGYSIHSLLFVMSTLVAFM